MAISLTGFVVYSLGTVESVEGAANELTLATDCFVAEDTEGLFTPMYSVIARLNT